MTDGANEIQIDFTAVDVTGKKRHFATVKSLYEFVSEEFEFWDRRNKEYPTAAKVTGVYNSINGIKGVLEDVKRQCPNFTEPNLESVFKKQEGNITPLFKSVSFSSTPFTKHLLGVQNIGDQQAQAFWNVVTGLNTKNDTQIKIQLFSQFEGALLAFEFIRHDESKLPKRSESEKRSLESLMQQLTGKIDEVTKEADDSMSQRSKQFDGFLAEINRWKSQEAQKLQEQKTANDEQRDAFFTDAEKRRDELERHYTEILRLKKPAKYWNDRALKYRNQGRAWGALLLLFSGAAVGVFVYLFFIWLKPNHDDVVPFSIEHWHGMILLLTALSLVAFILRTFGRLTFSAFHLQRDAEEREQLAYLYLALVEDSTVSEDARKIVMQALFSRSSSGLLSGDHGPTLPNVAEVISKAQK